MLPWRDYFLQEILRLEGTGGRPLQCSACSGPASLRCQDCFGLDLICKDCFLDIHIRQPFHRVEVRSCPPFYSSVLTPSPQQWNGRYFEKEHPVDYQCSHPSNNFQLTVFDMTGVHQIVIRYCMCFPEDPAYRRTQLLRATLFPATLVRPHTVFTFRLLDFFHRLQSQNKTNLYDFYNTIVRLCDSAGLSPGIVSFIDRFILAFIYIYYIYSLAPLQ
jgi:hypothetical protein